MKSTRSPGSAALTVAVAVAVGGGCTALLGIDGDFTASGGAGPGGAPSSSTAMPAGGGTHQGGGGSGAGAGGTGGTGGNIVTSGTINGTKSTIQVLKTTVATTPFDFTAAGVTVEALSESNDHWTTKQGHAVAGHEDQFEIEGVPAGPYLLHVHAGTDAGHLGFVDDWIWLLERKDVDLRVYTTLRPDIRVVDSTANTVFAVTDMTPWVTDDSLDYLVPTSFELMHVRRNDAADDLNIHVSDDAVTGNADWSTLAWRKSPFYQITPNDPGFLFHYGAAGSDGYRTLRDFAGPFTADMKIAGGTFDVGTTFTAVTRPGSPNFKIDVDGPAFHAAVTNDRITNDRVSLDYQASPAKLSFGGGKVGDTAHLILFEGDSSSTIDQEFSFGNPLDASWEPFVTLGNLGTIAYLFPGAAAPDAVDDQDLGSCSYAPADLMGMTGTKPGLLPMKNAVVGGRGFGDPTNPLLNSASPKVEWENSGPETPRAWRISAVPVTGSAGGSSAVDHDMKSNVTIRVVGDQTSARFPPGMLVPGAYYVFQIRAESCASCDYDKRPLVSGFPSCNSLDVSETFQVPAN